MSQLTDFAAKVEASFAAIKTGIQSLNDQIKALNDKITALQNSPGALTPEDQAALDQIQTDAQALASSVPVVPPVPAP